ncbi:PadR family transcriptional regulator [Halegenticoccus soli]|uniref:PadR family transcriptional regulator n=1 Tax=Halegenticoccus soli TaxID=1985678 RepID=UPI000C6D991E|nr:PadR family transcriptional regulator [Halegenticoccus soli]
MFELSGSQRDLLVVIAGFEHPSGQDIKEELEHVYEEEINHGRLYPNLDTLVQQDYVEKGTLDRRTNFYAVIDHGLDTLREWAEWQRETVPQIAH